MSPAATYVGRLAPSPTGLLHLGHAATFLTAHDRARNANGRLILRIDDLDAQRSKESFVDAAREDLQWLRITWDEETRESQHRPLYKAALERLLASAYAYACTCSRKDLHDAIQAPHEDIDDEPLYNGRCRPHAPAEPQTLQGNTSYRFHVPEGATVRFVDGCFGPQHYLAGSTAGADFGDFLIWRKDGLPSYQLACAVDDATMGITEVVRGRDLLKSTARQILLQRALQLPTPAYVHTDLVRDVHGQRLAKRHDPLSLRALRASGMSPEDVRAQIAVSLHQS